MEAGVFYSLHILSLSLSPPPDGYDAVHQQWIAHCKFLLYNVMFIEH